MLLANPHELSLLKERNPPLADALLSGDLGKPVDPENCRANPRGSSCGAAHLEILKRLGCSAHRATWSLEHTSCSPRGQVMLMPKAELTGGHGQVLHGTELGNAACPACLIDIFPQITFTARVLGTGILFHLFSGSLTLFGVRESSGKPADAR